MQISFHNSLNQLTAKMVALLWKQWSSLGVAGYGDPTDDSIIDPEALLLCTTHFGRYDSRLMDHAIDWLVKNGNIISVQRLQGLEKNWPSVADARVLSAIAEILCCDVMHRKWRVIADRPALGVASEFLFHAKESGALMPIAEPDPFFEKHGLLREPLQLRGMSLAPDPSNRQNLLLSLRALLGVNARAEIIAWLLAHESGHPAAIARATGYFSKSVQQILNEMLASGQLGATRIGREKHFFLRRRQDWQNLLFPMKAESQVFPRWVDWMPLYAAIAGFAQALSLPQIDEKSPSFQSIQLREAFLQAMPALTRSGKIFQMQASPEIRGAEMITSLLADINALIP